MRARKLVSLFLGIVVVAWSSTALAATEDNKFIGILRVATDGTILVTVREPAASTVCPLTLLGVPSGPERDRIFSLLVAAKTANRKINVEFTTPACTVTSVMLP
jgi:hypothetical protein